MIISVSIIGLVNGFDKLVAGNFHIQLYDTYYITNKYLVSAGLFLIICHIAYLARQIIHRFSTTLPNLILLAVSGLLIIVISQFISQLSTMNLIKGGWVIYPPLSALPKDFEFETSFWVHSPPTRRNEPIDIISTHGSSAYNLQEHPSMNQRKALPIHLYPQVRTIHSKHHAIYILLEIIYLG